MNYKADNIMAVYLPYCKYIYNKADIKISHKINKKKEV